LSELLPNNTETIIKFKVKPSKGYFNAFLNESRFYIGVVDGNNCFHKDHYWSPTGNQFDLTDANRKSRKPFDKEIDGKHIADIWGLEG